MFITQKKYNAEINKAFTDGYNQGKSSAIQEKLTPNELRALLGLKPVKCLSCKNKTLKIDDICIECKNGANHYEPSKCNVNCETCLHIHSTSQVCEKCDGIAMYEPYVQKGK